MHCTLYIVYLGPVLWWLLISYDIFTCWLLLRGGILQTVPFSCDRFRSIVFPIWVLIMLDSSTRVLYCGCSRHLVAKRGETGREMAAEFCVSVSLSCLNGPLTCYTLLRHRTDGFASPLRGILLRIFIAVKMLSLSAGFEPANLESNGKNDIHYTTENGYNIVCCL
jgi:hypothetical protein